MVNLATATLVELNLKLIIDYNGMRNSYFAALFFIPIMFLDLFSNFGRCNLNSRIRKKIMTSEFYEVKSEIFDRIYQWKSTIFTK